ncbi:MAG: cobalamin B12-binding domain-containing protein, partial [Desulfuromonadales bacterium]|nr:cobalamin B12-binding domain-containing protein [Desulfuromonadales bacterium]
MKMKIALLTLHSHISRPAFPLAAACLAAVLSKTRRQDVQLIDLFPDMTLATMWETVLASGGDLVAFPLYSWNRHPLLSLARELRHHRPQLRLVACGPEATADAAGVLAEGGLDGAVFSNEETPFGHLVEALAAGSSPAGTAGLLWQTPAGAVTGPPDVPSDPEALPSPWLTGVLTPAPGDSVPW